MHKAEISWRRVTEDGIRLQVLGRKFGGEWSFFVREKRYDQWEPLEDPPLEDWLELLDSVRRRVPRRLLQPKDEAHLVRRIRERFPDASL
jgi:hypothetical protein